MCFLFWNYFENLTGNPVDTRLVNFELLSLKVWMKRGGERFDYRTISKRSYEAMFGIFLCYNYCLRYTFEPLDKWLECIRKECLPDVVVMLVGNKYVHEYMTPDREVSYEEGRDFAERNGLMFMEISTDLEIVDTGFTELIRKVHELHRHKLNLPPTRPSPTSNAVIQPIDKGERKCSI